MVDTTDRYLLTAIENERTRQIVAAEAAYQTAVKAGTSPAVAAVTKQAAVVAAHAVVTTVQAQVAIRSTGKGK